eukprot:scaffold2062_cov273-Chaetoceros_neogracile.AAC.23
MSSAKVLYVNVSGVSSEVMKNLILAGIRGAIADGRPYPDALAETPTSFLSPHERTLLDSAEETGDEPQKKRLKKMSVAKAMQPHVLELNPLLEECEINEEDISSIPTEYFAKFDIVIASNIGLDEAIRISKATAAADGKFYLVHSFGFYACAMIDLGEQHTFRRETGKDKLSDVTKIDPYTSLEKMASIKLIDAKDRWHKHGNPPKIFAKYRTLLNYYEKKQVFPSEDCAEDFVIAAKQFLKEQGLDDDYLGGDDELKQLANTGNAEVAPVCAAIGGVIGNEVLKAISGKGEPANNLLLFNGTDGGCSAFTLK